MKMSKKLLALGLSVMMIAGIVGCGAKDDTASTDGDNSTVEDGGSSTPSGETRTIRIGTWYDHYFDSTHTDIHDDPSVQDEELAQAHFDIVKEVEDKYNVRIEFVNLTYDGIQESINTSILSGKPDCDIYEVDLSFGISAALNGYALNLEEILPADADVLSEQMIFKPANIGLDEGVYLFKSFSAESGLMDTLPLAYNKQLLDDAGLEDPRELYERGEWTWDKWREYMITLTKDTDGDGVTDVYGYGSRWDFLVYNLLMSNGTAIAATPTENLSSPEVGEALTFLYDMYNVDRVARPWNSEDFNNNTNAYMDGSVAFYISAAWLSSENQDATLGFDVVWCPWPIGPSGNAETNAFRNASSGNAWMIPAGVEDPEFVYNVFQDWQNWYHGDTEYRDGDLTWWEDCAITEENYAVMEMMGTRDQFDIWNAIGVEYAWDTLLTGTMTPAQFQETNKQLVQSALDAMYN